MRNNSFNTTINSNIIIKIDNACTIKIDNCITISDSIVIPDFFSPLCYYYFPKNFCNAKCFWSASENIDDSQCSSEHWEGGGIIGGREGARTHAYARTITNFSNNPNLFYSGIILIIVIVPSYPLSL